MRRALTILALLCVSILTLGQDLPESPKPQKVITPAFIAFHAALFASAEIDVQRFARCNCPETFPGLRGTRDVTKVRIAAYASSAAITGFDYLLAKKFKVGKQRYVAAGFGIVLHVLAASYNSPRN